jgi:transcriptional regulator with XRE-family HTH domain
MTTKDQPRRPRRQSGEGSGSARGTAAAPRPFCERLKAAREARGIDLLRVERDTKIRVKFLAALEEGHYEELPADVYARGFLRNYATYLGLNPDEAEEDWRRRKSAPSAKSAASRSMPPAESAAAKPLAEPAAAKPASGAMPAAPGAASVAESAAAIGKSIERRLAALRLAALRRAQPASEAAEAPLGGPQPIAMPRRALLVQPIHVILLALAVIILAVGLFFGMQVNKLLQYPSIAVTSPNQAAITLATGSSQYELKGTATAGTVINVSWDGRDPKTVNTDGSGSWSYVTPLHSGINQFDIHSFNADTNHNSPVITRLINVPVPTASPTPQLLTVESPTDGQIIADGNVTITGTTVSITSVTITPTYVGPPPAPTASPTSTTTAIPNPTIQPTLMPLPSATLLPTVAPVSTATAAPPAGSSPSPSASTGPAATTVIPSIDGKFTASLHLPTGRWKLSIVGSNDTGQSPAPVIVNVVVTTGGLTVVIEIQRGDALLKIWKDGVVMPGYPKTISKGMTVTVAAGESVWIRTSQMAHTYVTVNGRSYGQLGKTNNAAGSWRITTTGPPVPSSDV